MHVVAISNGLGNISSVTKPQTQSVENGRGLDRSYPSLRFLNLKEVF